MTAQLENQQSSLIEANRQLDERRRFTETVLGVSAGVIGLNEEGHIQLFNQSAEEFLELNIGDMIGTSIESAVPAMAELFPGLQNITSPERTG